VTTQMNRSNFSGRRSLMIAAATMLLLVIVPTSAIVAQTPQTPLPKAEQILDKYVEAIGGLATLEKINNRVSKGIMDIPAAGIQLSVTVYQARPDKAYSVIESQATGKIETGTDGTSAWQITTTGGPQLMEGKEKAFQLHMNIFDRMVYWRKVYKQVETTGIEDVAGRPCYKIIATPPDLTPQTLYFDKETNLLARVSLTTDTQAGTISVESTPSDYRRVDGVMLAFKNVIKTIGPERVTTIDKFEHNVNLPADRFAPPAEIKALIKRIP
jgi:outer membrane lipoprotein-sorting protein